MRIYSVHNEYQIRGGEEECQKAENELLQSMGHHVDTYNQHNNRIAELGKLKATINTVWSSESYQAVKSQIREAKYDVMHVHNFFPLISPSIYYAAASEKVPIVQTLHNYRLLCPNGLFFREGRVCEDCLGKSIPLPGIQNGCYRESKATSAVVAAMLTIHHQMQTWSKMVDCYIALTEFARQKFIEGGLPAEKIVVKPNFIPDPGVGEGKGGYALYVGRLSVEKGLDTLLAAWQLIGGKMPLKIIGDGQLASNVEQAVKQLSNVEWLGRKPLAEVYSLIGDATVLIFPSKWYETFGRVAIEAFAKGTPVIAANIGAIAELIDDGRTGIHFRPGDAQNLAQKIEWVMSHPRELAQMRCEARAEFEQKFTAKENYKQLINIYKQVCSMKV